MGGDLLGALYAGVSGLDSEATNLSIIANNVANSNTDGYKQAQVEFQTLVTGASNSSSFSPGGVTAGNRQLIDQQGLLQSTSSATDIAIQGSGMFVVNSAANGPGQVLYTRAGSFTQDSSGNFVNAAGYYLQGWPLDSSGRLPGAPGNTTDTTSSANLSSLQTVNVASVAGKASPTTAVTLVANLDSGSQIFPGAAGDVTMDKDDATNFGITANTIIVPTSTDTLTQGQKMVVSTGLNPTGYTYTYGGITYSRNATTTAGGAADYGSSGNAVVQPVSLASATLAFTNGGTSVVVTKANSLAVGDVINFSGTDDANGVQLDGFGGLDGDYYVSAASAGSYTITLPSTTTPPAPVTLNSADVLDVTNIQVNPTVTLTFTGSAAPPAGMLDGDTFTLANAPTVTGTGVTGGNLSGATFTVTNVAGNVVTFTATGATSTGTGSIAVGSGVTMFNNTATFAGGSAATFDERLFTGDILDATSPTTEFISNPTSFTAASLSFTITTASTGTSTFTYTPSAPNAALGQFNTLDNLATAISDVTVNGTSLTARVVNNQLYVSSTNGDDAITFANGSTIGTNTTPPLAGIDWVRELGLANVASATNRFSNMQGLANLVNNSAGLTATVSNPAGAASVSINVNDPLDTIDFTDASTNTGSVVSELGLQPSLNGGGYSRQTTGAIGPAYNPAVSSTNMASNAITPTSSRPITVYDSLGTAHNLNIAFLNTGTNTWAVEVYAEPPTDVNSSLPNGQIAYGTITFNGLGNLESVSSLLASAIPIDWTDGASPSSITMNWGTIDQGNGLTQYNSPFKVTSANQNGAAVGGLTSVSIGSTGLVTASFSNGQTQNLYQIPLGDFSDPDQLESISGNVFAQTSQSGQVNLQQAGSSGTGTIVSSSLEQSNVQLADQLTQMIVAQQAYQANTKVISTADTLLQSLDQIIQ